MRCSTYIHTLTRFQSTWLFRKGKFARDRCQEIKFVLSSKWWYWGIDICRQLAIASCHWPTDPQCIKKTWFSLQKLPCIFSSGFSVALLWQPTEARILQGKMVDDPEVTSKSCTHVLYVIGPLQPIQEWHLCHLPFFSAVSWSPQSTRNWTYSLWTTELAHSCLKSAVNITKHKRSILNSKAMP